MASIGMLVVRNYSHRLSQPILWIVTACAIYWTHSTAVCILVIALIHLRLPTYPPPPPPTPFHPPTPLYMPFVLLQLLQKRLLKIQQC